MIQGIESDCAKSARAEPRMKVLLAGELRMRFGKTGCRVVDLSRWGACLEADAYIPAGVGVTLVRGGLEAAGQVVWSRGHRCGVRFAEPIRATDLLVQMGDSRKADPARPVPAMPLTAAMPRSPSR